MVPVVVVIFLLPVAPWRGMAGKERTFIDGERRYSEAGKAEVIGAIVDSRHGGAVRLDLKTKGGRRLFHHGIEAGALRTIRHYRSGHANGQQLVEVEVEGEVANRLRRMHAQVFRPQEVLF